MHIYIYICMHVYAYDFYTGIAERRVFLLSLRGPERGGKESVSIIDGALTAMSDLKDIHREYCTCLSIYLSICISLSTCIYTSGVSYISGDIDSTSYSWCIPTIALIHREREEQ
ncbi:hypothetical protein CSUI_001845 [Cystoisospora suis]|uniref:Uncharacterized protein n=1 Tax=Cystoisospora suis TaxID=483139 RepID=A0A2C6LBB9_9APIC|nr:hypothetical protein CSUI_001845 [Cystoisospora suis]